MTPDMVVDAALIGLAIGGLTIGLAWTVLILTRAVDPERESDDLAVARAAGVLVTRDGVSSGVMAARVAWHTQPREDEPEVEPLADDGYYEPLSREELADLREQGVLSQHPGTTNYGWWTR